MEGFSEVTQTLLRKSGWSPQRTVDTHRYEQALREEGYPVPATVITFLRSFGGLKIRHPHPKVAGAQDYFVIDPLAAMEQVDKDVIDDYSQRVGAPLCLIGEAERGYMVLAMDTNGAVYAGYDDFLVKAGNTPSAAIEAFCRGWDMQEIA